MDNLQFKKRDFIRDRDYNFIANSFLNSLYSASFARKMKKTDFINSVNSIFQNLIDSNKLKISIVTFADDNSNEHICAYSIFKDNVLIYCYVKSIYRRMHLCSALLNEFKGKKMYYCFDTPLFDYIRKNEKEWLYNQFLFVKDIS